MKQQSTIEDYFVIGDLFTAALVSAQGEIDWLCFPYFDSPSIFARLLDPDAGSFAIETDDFEIECGYVANTAIVERKLTKPGQTLVNKDFMVPRNKNDIGGPQYLVRKICGVEGSGNITFTFKPMTSYGKDKLDITQTGDTLEISVDGCVARLHLPEASTVEVADSVCKITIPIEHDSEKSLILEYVPATSDIKIPESLEDITEDYWREWVAKGTFIDFCKENMIRSAITLKLMQFAPTGAMIAAPTTSLPEEIGGIRNWDYRYVWIRDATFTLYAFDVLGYKNEAEQFFEYIHSILEKSSHKAFDVGLMYTIFGEPVPKEKTLDYMAGYKDSKPVRIGNEAADQFQLDVYGALIDAIYFANKNGFSGKHQDQTRQLVTNLVEKIEEKWQQKDSGIWEVRSEVQHYTYSKVMSWVGADRASKMAKDLGFTVKEQSHYKKLADNISQWIWQTAYDDKGKNLTQYPESPSIDSTNFLFVLLQFLDKHDPQTKEIIEQTRQALSYDDIFVRRYNGDDGLPGKEGAFILSSFWLVSALAILEETDKAKELFDKMEVIIAKHGLLSEEIDPDSNLYLGNYPQAFSHLGYILSAHYLNKYIQRKKSDLK